jgi:hypothetical protein
MAAFAGTDASRGLAKMDLKSTQYGIDDLTASEKNTLREVSFSSRGRETTIAASARAQIITRQLQLKRIVLLMCVVCSLFSPSCPLFLFSGRRNTK